MAQSEFLKNLQNAVNTGEFNSDAAKKIVEINELASKVVISDNNQTNTDKLSKLGLVTPSAEDELALNSQYEQNMAKLKMEDTVNKQLAILIDMDDMVIASISDVISFVSELDERFDEEIKSKNPTFVLLQLKLEELKSKYSSFINN